MQRRPARPKKHPPSARPVVGGVIQPHGLGAMRGLTMSCFCAGALLEALAVCDFATHEIPRYVGVHRLPTARSLDEQRVALPHKTFVACGFTQPRSGRQPCASCASCCQGARQTILTTVQKFQEVEGRATHQAARPRGVPVASRPPPTSSSLPTRRTHPVARLGAAKPAQGPAQRVFLGFSGRRSTRRIAPNPRHLRPYIDTYTIEQAVADGATGCRSTTRGRLLRCGIVGQHPRRDSSIACSRPDRGRARAIREVRPRVGDRRGATKRVRRYA